MANNMTGGGSSWAPGVGEFADQSNPTGGKPNDAEPLIGLANNSAEISIGDTAGPGQDVRNNRMDRTRRRGAATTLDRGTPFELSSSNALWALVVLAILFLLFRK